MSSTLNKFKPQSAYAAANIESSYGELEIQYVGQEEFLNLSEMYSNSNN